MHSAEVFFESDLMDIGWQLRDVLSCMSVYGENSNSVRKLFHRDEREFEYCLQTLDNRSKTSSKLRVLKITIPYLCDTQNLSAVANWILGLHFRCRKKIQVIIDIHFFILTLRNYTLLCTICLVVYKKRDKNVID